MARNIITLLGMALSLLAALPSAPPGEAAEKTPSRWVNLTGQIAGDNWGFGGITIMAAVPGSDIVIAGVSEQGLWATADLGKTWIKLGSRDPLPIKNHPYQLLFDPSEPRRFWESGNSGPGVFRTDDGGETFRRLGNLDNVDGLGIDFTDQHRRTLVACIHGQIRSLQQSIDGGETWTAIGDRLPAKTNINSDLVLFDARNFMVNAAGWQRQGPDLLPFGIFRTDNGGASFTEVSDTGPSGPPLVDSGGAIYWQTLWDKGLIKSTDRGRTWKALAGPVRVNPIELPGHKLLAWVEAQLLTSSDGGVSWEKFGEPLPFKPSGLCFCAKTRSIYAWRSTDAKEENVAARWDLP